MAVINHHSWKHAAAILISLYILSLTEATALPRGKGFSLKLIHPDSPNSPFYRGNLTNTQHSESLLNSSISHKNSTNIDTTPTAAYSGPRLPLVQPRGEYTFTVEVSIGSDKGLQTYQLQFDTASSLTWTQCAGCEHCLAQEQPLFDPEKSPTYSLLSDTDHLCNKGNGNYKREGKKCVYEVIYGDLSVVTGDLAKETFTFQTAGGGSIAIPQMIFGCTTANMATCQNGQGILGMGVNEESFAVQLAPYTDKRFSYCLMPRYRYTGDFESYLRFGDDIVMKEPFQKTPILTFPDKGEGYYLDLHDISFDDERIGIPQQVFQRQSNGKGGVIIDSGSEVSHLTPEAYKLVKNFMVGHLKSRGFEQVIKGGDICYVFKGNKRPYGLPGMTFHFKGVGGEGSADADLHIKGEQVFSEYTGARNTFCWEMMKNTEDETILGAYQQSDIRFTYDLNKMELHFATEDCGRDARQP